MPSSTRIGDQKYVPREVNVDVSDQRFALLRSGVHEGETVAAQGAFDLLAPAAGGYIAVPRYSPARNESGTNTTECYDFVTDL